MKAVASAAATVANLGVGFDVLGLCLAGPRDVVTAELTEDGLVTLVAVTGDGGLLPRDAADNCVGVVARRVLDRFGRPSQGVRLWLEKGLPLGSGMGSSSASSVAAALATAALLGDIPKGALLDACREGERLAAGSPHADNVAPCLLGGIVACLPGEGEAVDVLPLPVPEGLMVAVVKPDYDVRTADARAALPAEVPLADAVHNAASMASLVMGLVTGDLVLLSRSFDDRLATPYRKHLIRGFDGVVAAALRVGAIGAGISGSGPTVFALSDDRDAAVEIADAMVDAFAEAGAHATAVVSAVDPLGAQVALHDV